EPEPAEPMKDAKTSRFLPGNRAYRRRQVKERAKGISTLNPRACPSWLSPYVADGAELATELVERFPDDPAPRPLIGATVDAWPASRAPLGLGAAGDRETLKEARAWLRKHRSALATLAALARELREDEPTRGKGAHAALAATLQGQEAPE